MKRDQILHDLNTHAQEIRDRFGVRSLALFGSLARQEDGPESDVDLLVSFKEPPGFDGYMALKLFLEDLLGTSVDLVMSGALKPWARQTVEQEAIHVVS